MFNMPKVTIMNKIDVSKYNWCNEAVMFSVRKGKGTFTHKVHEEEYKDDDYYDLPDYYSIHTLNDIPVVRSKYPFCPTCQGMLAKGYGIENIDCPELTAARKCMNSDYKDIVTSAENIKPLLGLLDDGVYLLADIPHSPTDGEGNFFYSVPDGLKRYRGLCDSYYLHDLYACVDGFPAFLYPSQSAGLLSMERVDEYVDILRDNACAPRALAYYENGFFSLLLDGHHKAFASALLGKKVNCLTIIKADGCIDAKETAYCKEKKFDCITMLKADSCADAKRTAYYNKKTHIEAVKFSTITVPVKKGSVMEDYFSIGTPQKIDKHSEIFKDLEKSQKSGQDIIRTAYPFNDRRFYEAEKSAGLNYFTVEETSGIIEFDFFEKGVSDEEISEWISDLCDENNAKIRYAIAYFMVTDRKRAYDTAKMIIAKNNTLLPNNYAWKVLLNFKNDETEKFVIDYIVSHNKADECWDMANSYWDDETK